MAHHSSSAAREDREPEREHRSRHERSEPEKEHRSCHEKSEHRSRPDKSEHRSRHDKSERRSRPEKEVSHHRRTQQDHHHSSSSRSKSSSHKKKEPSGFLGSVLKWTAGATPAPKNDRRYYDSSNAWVRKSEHSSSRSRSHRDGESRRHREHKEERPRSLDREHRRRREGESSREHEGERKHRSRKDGEHREHRSRKDGEHREHRSRKDGERRKHRSDREKREHRDDREPREHRRKREHRHEEPRHEKPAHHDAPHHPELPSEHFVPAMEMLPSDETASQVQARLYKESAEVMGYDIRNQAPPTEPAKGKGKGVDHSNPYGDVAEANPYRVVEVDESNPYADVNWGEYHRVPVTGLNLPSGAGKTQDIIRERISRRNRESVPQPKEEIFIPAVAESQISPGTKWPPVFQPTNMDVRRPSFRPLSPTISINAPQGQRQGQEFGSSARRPPTPGSEYDDESVYSLDEEVVVMEEMPKPEVMQKRPPPAMLNNSNRRALERASRSGPPPAMHNRRSSLAAPMGRRPSGLDRQEWRPASSVYSQDPPPRDHEVDLARGVLEGELAPMDSISSIGPPVPPKEAFSHLSATVKPLALPRGSVYNRAGQMGPASYAGTEWPQTRPQTMPARKPVPISRDGPVVAPQPLKTKKGMFGKLKGMF